MKNQKRAFIIIIIAAAIFTTGTIIFDFHSPSETQPTNKKEKIDQTLAEKAVLTIDFGDKKETFRAETKKGATVFDFLKKATEEKNIQLKTKEYDFGIMITQIGKKENTKRGKNWLFYLNGERAKEAVNKIDLKPGDKVEFKYEKNPF